MHLFDLFNEVNMATLEDVNYILKVCKTNVDGLVKSATNPHNAPANFCRYLKELLEIHACSNPSPLTKHATIFSELLEVFV